MARTALRTVQEETKRHLRERQAAVGQGCHGPLEPFRCWRGVDGANDIGGVEGQGGQAYEVVTRYKL